MRKHAQQAFTLIEILIVVVILGILAAIVIPQFTSASDSAQSSSAKSQLQTIRSQLELARFQHQGTYPPIAGDTGWDNLTTETEQDADYTAGDGSGDEVGPYLEAAPVNPFTGGNTVAVDNSEDWQYDDVETSESYGQLLIVAPKSIVDKASQLGLTAGVDFVAAP